jgi:hypothetical protein
MSPEHRSRDLELRSGIFMVGGIGMVSLQASESGEGVRRGIPARVAGLLV